MLSPGLYFIFKLEKRGQSGQEGGTGRYSSLPHTTKRRITTNLKNKNNENCQKSKLYGSPITKELKKKHSSRLVGEVEMGSWGREDKQQGRGWQTGVGKVAASKLDSPTFTWG